MFEKCVSGLPQWFSDNINTVRLTALGDLAASGTSDAQIFVSDDAGMTWRQLVSDLTPFHCLNFS